MRELGLIAGVMAVAGGLSLVSYHGGSFEKFGSRVMAQALGYTADAGFKVKDILVTGRSQVPFAELLERLSIKKDMPILGVDIVEARESLSAIPWVKDVSISRRLPDKIIVELQERVPVALWQHHKKISLIDRDGVVLASKDLQAWQQLPLVVGEGAPQQVMELAGLLNSEPVIAAMLASATRAGKRRWDLRLKNGVFVKLPEQDVELALRRLVTLEEQKNILGRNIAGIDLRQPEGVVIKPAASVGVPAKPG